MRRRRRKPRHDRRALRRSQGPAPRVRRVEALAQPGARRRPSRIPQGGRRRHLRDRQGRDLRARRRIRLGQVHRRPHGGRPAAADRGRGGDRRRLDDRSAPAAGAAAAAPPHPDDLPGPLCEPQPALAGRRHRRRADPGLRPDRRASAISGPGSASCSAWSGCIPTMAGNIRTNSPAASASASRSPGRSPAKPSSSSATSRPPRSTSRCRRRSST